MTRYATDVDDVAGFVLAADRPDLNLVDLGAGLDPVANQLLHMLAINRHAGALMAMTPFQKLAEQLNCNVEQLRTAMHQIADAGYGDATYSTLCLRRWTPVNTAIAA